MVKEDLISLIIPVYDEGRSISKVISEIERGVSPKHEVLVVYDFDEDSTVPKVKKLQKKFSNIRLVKNNLGRGVVSAVKTGFKKALGNLIVVMPGDLADNPKVINQMYKEIKSGYEIVSATRYSKGGKKLGGGILKTALSRLAGIASPYLLGVPVTDITNGFKMYRKDVLDEIHIESKGGWEFAMEIIIKAHHLGYKIKETPSVWRDRTFGKSKFRLLNWLPRYLRWYLWGIRKRHWFLD